MSVLITGGAGFIGRHTAKLLSNNGQKVVLLDNLSTGRAEHANFGFFVKGDVMDHVLLRDVIRTHGVTSVVHLAASAHVADSKCRPDLYFENNTVGTAILLNVMAAEGVRELVFASSCSVYGDCDTDAAREEHPVSPVSPYGESKLSVERMLPWYQQAFGLRWIALRYFNVAGAEAGLGEDITVSQRIIPRVLHAALQPVPTVHVYGTSFKTPDGSAVRDFVHVTDVARANKLALDRVKAGNAGAVINIGAGVGVSVLEVVSAVQKQVGRDILWQPFPARAGDPARAIADCSRAERLLGWVPRSSNLEEIVDSVLRSQVNASPHKPKRAGLPAPWTMAIATPKNDAQSSTVHAAV